MVSPRSRRSAYLDWGKRVCDLALALPAAVILLPVAVLVALLVRMRLGTPVLFVQERPGLDGCAFRMLKFRTMRDATGPDGGPLPDDARLTALGRRLRRWSLDELPGLVNVLRGDMSLVGPRPLLMEYLDRYTPEQARRHEVRPGITGWAQVHGRNAVSWEQRFELDVWYVDHVSLALDLAILWRTLRVVIGGRGVSEPGRATMSPFMGPGGSGTRKEDE